MYSESPIWHFHTNNRHSWYVSIRKRLLSAMVLLALLSWSCNQSNSMEAEALYGKWDIFKAMRNGVETQYLRGGYMVIEQNGSMTINITGSEESGQYTFENNRIALNQEKEFIVESYRQDSMILRYPMNAESNFLFYLIKNLDEAN